MVEVVGDERELSKQAIIANDLDDPIVIAAFDWAKKILPNHKNLLKEHERLDSIPFSSRNRFFASLNKGDKHNDIFVNGAPEFLLEWSDVNSDTKKEINVMIEKMTREGKRLMGMAKKKVATSKNNLSKDDVEHGLEWVGLLAFSDPIRKGVRGAFIKTKLSGIKMIVITGDYAQTAKAVMHQLNIDVDDSNIILGKQLAKLSAEELSNKLAKNSDVKLFARTTPYPLKNQ